MKGRLLILTEDHTDAASSKAAHEIIAQLSTNGFSNLLLEYPCDITVDDAISHISTNIKECDAHIESIINGCTKQKTTMHRNVLLNMDAYSLYSLVAKIFALNVDDRNNKEWLEYVTVSINRYNSHIQKLNTLKAFKSKMKIIFCDLPEELLEASASQTGNEYKTDHARNISMCNFFEELIRSGRNGIAIVGANHTASIKHILEESGLLNNTVFINLYSHVRLDLENRYPMLETIYGSHYKHLFRKRILVDKNHEQTTEAVEETLAMHSLLMNGKISSKPAIVHLLKSARANRQSDLALAKEPSILRRHLSFKPS